MRVVTLVLTGITTLLVGGLEASPPPTINIQGSLAASDGSPITGTHAYRVTFLDAMVAPAQIGVVTGQVTLSESGRYSIVLEPQAGILDTTVTFYELAIDIGDDGIDASDVFPNLVQLHSVPFALLAANADLLGGSPASSFATISGLSGQFLRKDVEDTFSGSQLTIDSPLRVGIPGSTAHDVNLHGASAGARLFWDASKGALRAGRATDGEWDDVEVGASSLATGANTTARGLASTAMGNDTAASGFGSTAIGAFSTASGPTSVAIGSFSRAEGDSSIAMGLGPIASSFASTAMGRRTLASATGATAMGLYTEAIAEGAIAMGSGTVATNTFSTAMGFRTTASGPNSTAGGSNSTASGNGSTAMGFETQATKFGSTALGYETQSDGIGSTAVGYQTNASNTGSFAAGSNTTASGVGSIALGTRIAAQANNTVGIGLDNSEAIVAQANTMAIMGGNVGIANVAPDNLLVVGSGGAYCDGTNWVDGSSRDYKKDIQPLSEEELEELISTLDEVEMVKYLYKQEEAGATPRVGVIAEEMPDILATKDRKGLDTGRHIGFLMGVVKAMRAEMEKQKQLIQEQQKAIDELREIASRLNVAN